MKGQLKRLLRGSAIYGIGGFLNRFIGILLLPLFTSYLTPKDYGIISVLNVLILFVTQLFSLGLNVSTGICYFDKTNREKKDQTIVNAFIVLIISSLAVILLGFIFINKINYLLFSNNDYQYLVVLTLISSIFTILVVPFMLRLQFEERQVAFIVITVISTLMSIGSRVILVVFLKRSAQGMVEGTLISKVLTLLLFALLALKGVKFRFNYRLIKDLILLGLPMMPSFMFLYILNQGNIYFLKYFTSLEMVGIYSIGKNIGNVMLLIVTAFSTAWMPFFLSFINKRDEAKKIFSKVLTYFIFGTGLLSLLFYVFAKPLVILLTQPEFFNAYKIIGLIATANCLIGVFSIFLPPVYFAKKVKYVTLIQLISVIFYIGAGIILIRSYDIVGAGIAYIFGYLIMAISLYLWNKRNRNIYLNIKYEWKRILPFVLSYVFCAIIILWDKEIMMAIEIIVSIFLYFLLLLEVYFLFKPSEREFIKNIYGRFYKKFKKV